MILSIIFLYGCEDFIPELPGREDSIPSGAVKFTPATDDHPPIMHSDDFKEPVPLPYPVNTAGAEDSPFIPAGSDELYFFFVGDLNMPVYEQIRDPNSGIFVTRKSAGGWITPKRVMLQHTGKLAMDGCAYVHEDTIWFCSAREGYTGVHWFKAKRQNNMWTAWRNADFPSEMDVGELHFTSDQQEVYFHSSRPGGKGETDIWYSILVGDEWQEPENIAVVNTEEPEGMPYLTPYDDELWFNRRYQGSPAIFRSKLVDGEWQEPELIVSQFAGEPTLDSEGNLYFVHHYFEKGRMKEADIFMAEKK